MPVLMIAEQPNLDEGTYASMLEQPMPLLRSANGFMSHAGGPSPAGGTRIIEIWESKADQQKFFNQNLKPNLPPGLVPDLTHDELHTALSHGARIRYRMMRMASWKRMPPRPTPRVRGPISR